MAEGQKELPPLQKQPITKEQLKLYAEASLDFNLIHLDDAVAREAGLPGVIAHGMLTMGFVSEFLYQALDWLGCTDGKISSMNCRFKAMTFPGDIIRVTGVTKEAAPGQFQCDFEARNQKGLLTASGQAILSR